VCVVRFASAAYAEQMHRSPTARLFVAVDPPADVCLALAAWARSAARAGNHRVHPNTSLRVLDPELLHVTLCFLGNRPVGEMDALAAQLSKCEGAAGELSLGAPLWLPSRRPRALAVELHDEDGRLARLQAQTVGALQQASDWQAPGGASADAHASTARRRFHPHVTVARMGRGATRFERFLPPTPLLSFTPSELVLYRSWLSPAGASYEAIASHPIG
jgi:RNA 2',3'-cyclic 3'-phosphodiesterase